MERRKTRNNICRCAILLLSLFAIPSLSLAANHYVRVGATGLADGSDWNNAYTALPATLIRGDTYYVADGSYSSYVFDDAASGTTLITIKKATIADHGTDIGWNNTFGDGQAVFSPSIEFRTSNWLIDGQTRIDRKSGHGFKIFNSPAVSINLLLTGAITNITLRYVEDEGDGRNSGNCFRQFYSIGGASNITLEYSYFHDMSNSHFVVAEMNNVLVQHTTFARNHSDASCHGASISDQGSDNVTFRYNFFEDIEGTAVIDILNRGGPNQSADNWDIYGNMFMVSSGNPFNMSGLGTGVIVVINGEAASNWRIHNNTFVNLNWTDGVQTTSSRFNFSIAPGTNRQAFNNLWYNCTNANHGGITANYNYYINTLHDAEVNEQTAPTTDPFVNWANYDLHLNRATNAGLTLSAPFNVDPEGIIRGGDGNWDRGAFEFGGTVTRPEPPTNLRVIP